MRFFWTAGLIFGIFVKAFSQSALVLDTLRAHTSFYVTGDALDSSLRNSRSSLSNLYLRDGIFFDPFRIYQPFGTFLQRYNSTERLPVFSALPFLGVHYSFGMQGSQHTALNYFQLKSLLLEHSIEDILQCSIMKSNKKYIIRTPY